MSAPLTHTGRPKPTLSRCLKISSCQPCLLVRCLARPRRFLVVLTMSSSSEERPAGRPQLLCPPHGVVMAEQQP